MKKSLSFIVIIFTALVLVACSGSRVAPEISGLASTGNITLGESIDVLKGVKANVNGKVVDNDNIVITTNPGTVKIDKGVVTPEVSGSYVITLTVTDPKDDELVAKASMFLEVSEDISVTEIGRTVYTFDKISEEALNGFEVFEGTEKVSNLDIVQGNLVYKASKAGDNKVVKAVNLEKGGSYKIVFEVKASDVLTNIELSVLKADGTTDYNKVSNLQITKDYNELSISFVAIDDTKDALITLKLGSVKKDDIVEIKQLKVIEEVNREDYTVEIESVNDNAKKDWKHYNDEGVSVATINDGAINIAIDKTSGGIWEQKLNKQVNLEANKSYKLTYKVKSDKDIKFELMLRTEDMVTSPRDENYIWSAPQIKAGVTNTITQSFTTKDTDLEDINLLIQFGNAVDDNNIVFSDFVFTSFDGFEETNTRFTGLPTGFDSYEHDGAKATLYVDASNGELVYDVTKFGTDDWFNKVFMENQAFKEDSTYIVEFSAKASKALEFFFAINPMGEWNPKVTDMVHLTTDYQTFSFATNDPQTFTQQFELLFQFGGFTEGAAKIYFEHITIIELA